MKKDLNQRILNNIKLGKQSVKESYYKLINLLLEKNEELRVVEDILNDECYNRHQVVDLIAYRNLIPVLHNSKVNSVITDFWRGPYERNSFMNDSYNFQVINKAMNANQDFFGYHVSQFHNFDWWKSFKNWDFNFAKETKGHFFQFEVWN